MYPAWNILIHFLSIVILWFSIEFFSYLFGGLKYTKYTKEAYICFLSLMSLLVVVYCKIPLQNSFFQSLGHTYLEYMILVLCYVMLYFFDTVVGAIYFQNKFTLHKQKMSSDLFLVLIMSIIEEIIYRGISVKIMEIYTNQIVVIALLTSVGYSLNHRYLVGGMDVKNKKYQFISKFCLGIILFIIMYNFNILCAVIGHIIYNFGTYLWRESND